MKLKKSMLVAGAVTTLGVAGVSGLSAVSAQSNTGDESLVEKIASRFNLNQDDVQAVFDESKAERTADMEAEFSERLQDKVDDGDITAEQKTLIEDKAKEQREAMKAEHEELETWAEQNGIDLKYLRFGYSDNDDRLQEAVDDGDISSEQKTLIENKSKELEDKRNEDHDALEKWAEDNDIDINLLGKFGGYGPGRGGYGGPMM